MTVAAAASSTPAATLAAMIRDRRGTRVNVVSAVCCDHSEVTSLSDTSRGLPFVAAFTVAVHRNWPTALVTSTLLTLAAWPSLILYSGDGTTSIGVLMVVVAVLMLAATG